MPLLSDKISAMPIIPMLPAKAVKNVRPFFVIRLLSDSDSAVPKLIEVFLLLPAAGFSSTASSYGALSSTISPSFKRTMRLA